MSNVLKVSRIESVIHFRLLIFNVVLQALKESEGQIGKVFLEKVDLFKVYAIYCSNQPMINARIREFEMKNKAFAKHLQVYALTHYYTITLLHYYTQRNPNVLI
jgi:hypothetical protein